MPTGSQPRKESRAHVRIVQAGMVIRNKPEPGPADKTFLARQFVQVTLPHAEPKGEPPIWSRRNGNLQLSIRPGYKVDQATRENICLGYPYGTIPRLVLFWITTEALRTRNPRIGLGDSLNAFMRALGLNPDNGRGPRSDAHRLREQMERLFRSSISFESVDGQCRQWLNMRITAGGVLWWDLKNREQPDLARSWVMLSPEFFEAIVAAPVPADMRALRGLKNSSLALDLYAFVSYRAFVATQNGQAQFVTWPQLMAQLGTDYARVNDFRIAAKDALRKIKVVLPGVRLGRKQGGVEILPGASAVPPRRAQRTLAAPPVDQKVIPDEMVTPGGDEMVTPGGDEMVTQPIDKNM